MRDDWSDVPEHKHHCADCGWLNPTEEDIVDGIKIDGNWYCHECMKFRNSEYDAMLEFSDMSFEEMMRLILQQRKLIFALLLCKKFDI